MCLGVPMQVISAAGNDATCRGRGGTRHVDVALVAPVRPGEWLLTFLGAARGRLDADEAARVDRALDALESIERGERIDVAAFFADLVDREPELPEHLRGQP
ncbi:MAG TPA: HypC/HybG/HupF family hydrogenase formation chaperone [Steroidobacteraceae bacterium]|nr:HypC/HybG/HupF family hydrogenase formation chaperone [Steroidobacteraceae bacterium]